MRRTAFTLALCGGLILAGAASAGVQPNCKILNGVNLNGVNLNGITLNGLNLNGVGLNGVGLNGVGLNGVDASVATAPTIRSITLASGQVLRAGR